MHRAEREVTYSQVMLVTFSKNDGPRVPVNRLRKVEVRDASHADSIRVHFEDHDLHAQPAPLEVRGSGTAHTIFPKGTVWVERVSGDSPITVLAHCERFVSRNGHKTHE